MIFKLRFGKYRLTITLSPVIDVYGVNSLLKDGTHILMWDWDNTTLEAVIAGLNIVQLIYDLPNIYVLESFKNKNYMAYCFVKVSWPKAKEIIAATPLVCENFYKWGVFRRKFTLRISPKEGRLPKFVHTLYSDTPEECGIQDMQDFVKYETLPRSRRGWFINLGSGNGQARRL